MLKLNSFIEFFLIVSFFVLALSYESSAGETELENAKYRRGRSAHLFPFPRVGRSIGISNVDLPMSASYEEYEDMPIVEMKRAVGLIQFPRVGRNNNNNNQLRQWSKLAAALQYPMNNKKGAFDSSLWYAPRFVKQNKNSVADGGFRENL